MLKGGFPLARLATGTGTGILSRRHGQFDIFSFPQENFPVHLFLGKTNDNQFNWLLFANAAFLLYLNSQSNTSLLALLLSLIHI